MKSLHVNLSGACTVTSLFIQSNINWVMGIILCLSWLNVAYHLAQEAGIIIELGEEIKFSNMSLLFYVLGAFVSLAMIFTKYNGGNIPYPFDLSVGLAIVSIVSAYYANRL